MSTFADAITSGGNPTPGFSTINSIGGFSPEYICRKLCPLSRPPSPAKKKSPKAKRGPTLACLLDGKRETTRKGKRVRAHYHTYTKVCPYCQKPFTGETTETDRHEHKYCSDDCERLMMNRKHREVYRKPQREAT